MCIRYCILFFAMICSCGCAQLFPQLRGTNAERRDQYQRANVAYATRRDGEPLKLTANTSVKNGMASRKEATGREQPQERNGLESTQQHRDAAQSGIADGVGDLTKGTVLLAVTLITIVFFAQRYGRAREFLGNGAQIGYAGNPHAQREPGRRQEAVPDAGHVNVRQNGRVRRYRINRYSEIIED